MPEATVDENDLFAATEGKIRFAGQSAHMALGSVAMCLKNLQNDVFRTGVFSANLLHPLTDAARNVGWRARCHDDLNRSAMAFLHARARTSANLHGRAFPTIAVAYSM